MGQNFGEIVKAVDKVENQNSLSDFIEKAINLYQKTNPNKRIKEIADIRRLIVSNDDPIQDLKVSKARLKQYFNSQEYYRGYTGYSYLEDCIHAALFLYEDGLYSQTYSDKEEIKKQALIKSLTSLLSRGVLAEKSNLKLFIPVLMNKQDDKTWADCLGIGDEKKRELINQTIDKSLACLEPHAEYAIETVKYDFSTMIHYAIRNYLNIESNPSEIRTEDIEFLKLIAARSFSTEDDIKGAIADINAYFEKRLKPLQGSRLRDLVIKAVNSFVINNQSEELVNQRKINTKTWVDKEKGSGRKIVLALHGLGDSVDTFNGVAEQYVDAGYKVIAYEQSGHGYDERRNKEDLNLQQMQFDFYKMLEKYTRDESIDEIVLIGHSLGGAIIANSLHTIEQLDTAKKIKKVQLLAPAVMKNPLLQIISNLPTLLFKNEGDKTESVEYATNARLKRIGGPSALSSFFDFIALIANAFRILRAVFNSTRVFTMPLEIHYAEDDGLVSASNFKDLEAEKKSAPSENKNAVQVVSYARGRHHLHAGNSYNHIELTKDTALVKTC